MKRFFTLLVFLVTVLQLYPQEAELSLRGLAALVLAKDPNVSSSEQSALLALHSYKGTVAQALPQIDFTGSYSLGYTPYVESEMAVATPTFSETVDLQAYDQATHSVGAKLSLSQLLPTGGSAFLNLENLMTAETLSSLNTIGATGTTTTYPDPEFAQKPKVTLGITQPIFLNGKILDFELFPAIFRKAQLGYQKADHQRRLQTNQTLTQAIQLFLSIVQLRKNLQQAEKTLAVGQGNQDNLQRNFSLGQVSESDLLDSKIAVSTQKQGILEMRASLARAERSLAHSIGRDSLAGVSLGDAIPALELAESGDQLLRLALDNSPALLQQALAAEEKRVDDVLAGQQYASSLSLAFSYAPRYPFTASPPYTADFARSFSDLYGSGSGTDWSFSAELKIHLFDGGQGRETHEGNQALVCVGQNSLISQRQAIQDQLELDLLSRNNLSEKVALLGDAVDLAARKLETEQSLLSLGKSTQLNVDSKRADQEAKLNDLWRAKADLFLVIVDLASLTGKDIGNLIEGSPQ
jgi:outer membrane protein TolC